VVRSSWTIHRTSMKLIWWMVLSLFFCSRGFQPEIIATDTGGGSVRVVHQQLVHICLNYVCFQNLTALLNPFRTGAEVHLGIHWPRSWNTIGIHWGKHCTWVPVYNSNKSPTRCNSFSVYYPYVYLQLSVFRAFSRPSSGAQWLLWQPLVLPSYRGDSRAVFMVGPAGRSCPTTNTARLSPLYEGKTRQRLPPQSLSSWWWAGKCLKHFEL
jgi:hypothetical protein